jgi:hypothetical protein
MVTWYKKIAGNVSYVSRLVFFVCLAGFLLWSVWGCSGGSPTYPTLEGNLLRYNEGNMIDFRLSGESKCELCSGDENFVGLYVELIPKGDPTHSLSSGMFDGLGYFSFPSLRAVANSVVQVYGTLYKEDAPEQLALRANAEFTVPDEDDKTVSVILNFLPQ